MLILICKVIGFFQGILKGKKSEFNYRYSKKHHGTERLRPSHVCFTPLSKMQAGRGRGGTLAGMPRCAPHPPSARGPRLPAEGPCVTPLPRESAYRRRPPAIPRRAAPCAPAQLGQDESSGRGGGGTVSAQAGPGFGRVFFHQVAIVFTKTDFQQ